MLKLQRRQAAKSDFAYQSNDLSTFSVYSATQDRSRYPVAPSFKITAYIFIVFGLLSAIDLLFGYSNRLWLDFGAFQTVVGIGLLRLKPNSWKWALAAAWIEMACTSALLCLTFFEPRWGYIYEGQRVYLLPTAFGFTFALVMFCVGYWQYYVLIHRRTMRLFDF